MTAVAQQFTPDLSQFPAALKARRRWVVWRYQQRKGKWTKVPHQPGGGLASATDPATWTDMDTAAAALHTGWFAGIGFVLGDCITGVDLDGCIDPETGELAPWAVAVVERLNAYTEVTPSGRGLHILAAATLPGPGLNRRGNPGGREIYNNGRFFTVTGQHLAGTPTTLEPRQAEVEALYRRWKAEGAATRVHPGGERQSPPAPALTLDDTAILDKAQAAGNGRKFAALYGGDWQGAGYGSPSEADLALCALLAFWTDDPATIDRLFRQSRLFRAKWDTTRGEGDSYGGQTIRKALATIRKRYEPASMNTGTGGGHRPPLPPLDVYASDPAFQGGGERWR